jgi:hypothetical protein
MLQWDLSVKGGMYRDAENEKRIAAVSKIRMNRRRHE